MRDSILMALVAIAFMMPSNVDPLIDNAALKEIQSYAEISDKSFKDAESTVLTRVVPDVPDIKEGCDGSGWIDQADGHRSRCPGCEKCGNGDVGSGSQMELIEPKQSNEEYIDEVFEEVIEVLEPEEKPVQQVQQVQKTVRHKCKCDTRSSYCRCIQEFGECKCNKK